ncbi:hypothetical protein [Capnocytophaga sp. oral taxon 338]|jgi:hypothetical protein|uniref:hypothetical protein n=1 Tax=Capnocytophaga sp. oral taxon 338 TaxID=710239 RepID=UPI000202E4E7|nr:hypothetical protein [Capnocytophaga sp. oral taxon 338]EGD33781.1 hypothetical protein HMPREF9071_1663 [Capnocytophaga sp. oral taxon 338 str. F0234]
MKLQATLYIPEDKEDFHIDIYDEQASDYQIAEIFRKGDKTIIDIYNNPNDTHKELDLEEFIRVLLKSYNELKI